MRSPSPTHQHSQRAAASLQTFKSFFPSRSAPKGSELLLVKLPSNAGLAVEFAGVELGRLADEVVAREVFASYFLDGGREISPKVRCAFASLPFSFDRQAKTSLTPPPNPLSLPTLQLKESIVAGFQSRPQ